MLISSFGRHWARPLAVSLPFVPTTGPRYGFPLHDALPILWPRRLRSIEGRARFHERRREHQLAAFHALERPFSLWDGGGEPRDRKSTRLNSTSACRMPSSA